MTPRLQGGSFLRAVLDHVEQRPEARACVLIREDGEHESISRAALHSEALAWAQALQSQGVAPGSLVLIGLDHSRALIESILGTWYAGAVPAVTRYASPRLDVALHARRLSDQARDGGAAALLVGNSIAAHLGPAATAPYRVVRPEDVRRAASLAFTPSVSRGDALAYVQYTSGTSGPQKAVAHTHAAMCQYLEGKIAADAITADSVGVSWLPLYHDLGLLSGLVAPLVTGTSTVLMSPFHWVRDPKLLLRSIDAYAGTMSWMPNFGLEHCVRAIREADIAGIDLRSWRTLVSGGELVRHSSQQAFARRFAPYGFAASALQAGYGMAENIEGITTSRKDRPLAVDWVRLPELRAERRAVPEPPGAPAAVPIVSCGVPMPGTRIRIVDGEGRELPDRQVGEIVVQSPYCLSGGYYRRPELTEEVLRDGWLQTGDLGYVAGGELFVCGRQKDVIIVAGSNIHPEDLEAVAGDAAGVVPGRAVAFGVPDPRMGTERVVLVCELADGLGGEAARDVERRIRRRCVGELDVTVGEVAFRPKGWIVKSSSGKLARPANREKFLAERAVPTADAGAP